MEIEIGEFKKSEIEKAEVIRKEFGGKNHAA